MTTLQAAYNEFLEYDTGYICAKYKDCWLDYYYYSASEPDSKTDWYAPDVYEPYNRLVEYFDEYAMDGYFMTNDTFVKYCIELVEYYRPNANVTYAVVPKSKLSPAMQEALLANTGYFKLNDTKYKLEIIANVDNGGFFIDFS